MLTFLQPIFLWALAAVAVPLIIHLWNNKEGKTLKVGSISLLRESTKARAHNLRLSQWLLLLLRCLLIICLAIILAKPVTRTAVEANDKGWILFEKNTFPSAYQLHHLLIDSLVKKGYALHYLDTLFGRADVRDTASLKTGAQPLAPVNVWTLLTGLQEQLPEHFPVVIFTGNRLRNVGGRRPQLSLPISWYIIPSDDTIATWVADAFQKPSDSIQAVVSHSKPYGNYNEYLTLSLRENGNAFSAVQRDDGLFVVAKDSLIQPVKIDTTTMNWVVYASEKYMPDAKYLQASLSAISRYSQHKTQIQLLRSKDGIVAPVSWLFWLSDEPLPAEWQRSSHVFQYVPGRLKKSASFVIANEAQDMYANADIALYQYVSDSKDNNEVVWRNGFNEPLLTREKDSVCHYRFYTRFSPQWTDLVWNASFPKLLHQLVFEQEEEDKMAGNDLRAIDATQMQPAFEPAVHGSQKESALVDNDISHLFWLAAFFLFALERILSFILNNRRYA